MKKSKLLKLITLSSLTMIIGATPLTLCQCGSSSNENDPSIDPSVSSKVNISTTTDKDGNSVSTLKTKSTSDKITGVSVSIGSNLLTKDTDYTVSGLSTNSTSVVVTIFKATLNKYTGDIVIKPTLVTEPAVLSSISCPSSPISIEVNDTVKASDITVKATYSDSSTKTLTWNTDYKVYKGTEEQTSFGAGIQFTSKGSTTFTIKAVADQTITTSLIVNVDPETATITFKAEGGTLSTSTKKVEKGTLWGSVVTPTTTPDYGYYDNVTWRKGSVSGEEMKSTDPIDSAITIYACFEERNATDCGIKTFTKYNAKLSSAGTYIPAENYDESYTEYYCKRVTYENDSQYTFQITLDGSDITNVRYFWIYQLTATSGTTGRLFPVQSIAKSIVSVKKDSVDIGYSVRTASNGKYIALTQAYTSGTIEITIQFHEDKYTPLSFVPAFEKSY